MQNSIISTISGLFGGMTKAISSGFILCRISFPHIIEIAIYASVSALVGYLVKVCIDYLKSLMFKPKNSDQR